MSRESPTSEAADDGDTEAEAAEKADAPADDGDFMAALSRALQEAEGAGEESEEGAETAAAGEEE